MFRNYLAAALRNMVKNRAYAAISIASLALGLASALVIALHVRSETSHDTWFAHHEDAYFVSAHVTQADGVTTYNQSIPAQVGPWLNEDFPEVTAARLAIDGHGFRHGDVEALETIAWADLEFPAAVPLPTIAGDFAKAMAQPDGIAITRAMARKYFGRDAPLGETLEMDRGQSLQVLAVLADFPANSSFAVEIFASARNSGSRLAALDRQSQANLLGQVPLFLRMKSSASVTALQGALPEFVGRHWKMPSGMNLVLDVKPIAEMHLQRFTYPSSLLRPPGDPAMLSTFTAVAVVIVIVACINFITLMMARFSEHAVEVGVRKTCGARRYHVIAQFVGGTIAHGVAAAILAGGAVIAGLPALEGFLHRRFDIELDTSLWPALIVLGLGALLGALSGLGPASLLSGIRPVIAMKAASSQQGRWTMLPQAVVGFQFATLIAGGIAAATIQAQVRFATDAALGLQKDEVLVIAAECTGAFGAALPNLPGVAGLACSSGIPLVQAPSIRTTLADGTVTELSLSAVDTGFHTLYGLSPLAGRFFTPERTSDILPRDVWAATEWSVIINASAVSKLGFARPEDAIGVTVRVNTLSRSPVRSAMLQIIGVSPDFVSGSVRDPVAASFYYAAPSDVLGTPLRNIHVKLVPADIGTTLERIDALWLERGDPRPIRRTFFDATVEARYLDLTLQARVLGALTAISLCLSCLGVFGLASLSVRRRTREIGIRKAMGARSTELLRLLLWQFAQPVLLANLLAWPAAYLMMRQWLEGFAYHVEPSAMTFLGASLLALLVAILTVAGHAVLAARAQPVTALRYE